MNNTPVFDIESIRARLGATAVPIEVCTAYLQLLTNLNALSVLASPNVDLQDEQIERIIQAHQTRKRHFEAEFPELAVAARQGAKA